MEVALMKVAPFIHPKFYFGFEESPRTSTPKIYSSYQKFCFGFGDICGESASPTVRLAIACSRSPLSIKMERAGKGDLEDEA